MKSMTIPELLKIRSPRDPFPIDGYAAMDDYGHYMTGTFFYKNNIVIVSHNNERWHLTIKSKTPLGLHKIEELRNIFIPDDVKMAHLLPSRSLRQGDATKISLWEVSDYGKEDRGDTD